ncbi:MAG: hypothetical protein JWQ25_57 [Daejeonella sp.]|nr:hypothetical protein [Daejeonella sp.]
MPLLHSIIESISSGIIGDFIKEKIFTRNNIYWIKSIIYKKQRYYNELRGILKDMPFIYKDFDADVLSDFQSIEFRKRNSKQFLLRVDTDSNKRGKQPVLNSFKDFVDVKKLLFVGSAGVDKSTLMRHIVLQIINSRKNEYFKNPNRIIPVFVQLKGIGANLKSPILTHLITDITLFKNKSGLETLKKHASNKELLIILDGYDEIQIIGGDDYISYEISILFSFAFSKDQLNESKINTSYLDIYKLLCECRVYLTTREEFYNANSLEHFEVPNRDFVLSAFQQNFQALNLIGLGELRYNYVKKIFDKNVGRAAIFKENLNPELFISELDSIYETELKELSLIPLYLTIMCFIYIDHIRKEISVSNIWLTNMDKLIYECIMTLLSTSDLSKASKMSRGWREAFIKRRSDYPLEKLAFLEYFSFQLLLDGISIFDYEYLKKVSIYYFNKNSISENTKKILVGFTNSTRSNPDIAMQLLYSSIFTTVCLIKNEYSYDFPHRRFKDVLATRFVEKNDAISILLNNAENKNLFEFLIYFFKFCEYDRNREFIIVHFLAALDKPESLHYNELLVACLKEYPYKDFYELLYINLKEWLDNNAAVRIKRELISPSFLTYSVVDFLYQYLSNENSENYNTVNFALDLMLNFGNDKLDVSLLESFPFASTLVGQVIFKKYEYLSKFTKGQKTADEVLNALVDLSGIQKCLFICSLMGLEDFKKIPSTSFDMFNFEDQILFAVCYKKFVSSKTIESQRDGFLHPIIVEIGEEVIRHNSITELLNSNFINRLNNRITSYNNQTQRDVSSVEYHEKKLLIHLSGKLAQTSDKDFHQLKQSINFLLNIQPSYLRPVLI